MNRGGAIIWVALGLIIVGVMAATMSLPIWKQNRYNDLIKAQLELKQELSITRQHLHETKLRFNELASRKSVGGFAEEVLAMGIHEVPLSVEVYGE